MSGLTVTYFISEGNIARTRKRNIKTDTIEWMKMVQVLVYSKERITKHTPHSMHLYLSKITRQQQEQREGQSGQKRTF